ncbi:MAG: glycosyltransferase family 4 protein [bacterium]
MGRDLALHLAGTGAKVQVLCPSPSRPISENYADYNATRGPLVRMEDGVEVVRLPSFTAPKSRVLARMWESASFGRHVCRYMRAMRNKPDVVYMNAWPLFAQAIIANFCLRRRIPIITQVMDVYPESLVRKLPAPIRGAVETPLLWLDRRLAKRVQHVIVISKSMLRDYAQSRHLQPGKLSLIHTWCDDELLLKMPERNVCHDRYKMQSDKFTFLFLGNIGPVAGVAFLIQAFHAAKLPNAQLVIAGDGSAKADCMRLNEHLGSTSIYFISDPDVSHTPHLLGMANACLLPMQKGSASSSIPSKLMAYMLSGQPIITSVDTDSDTARCIREADCGWVGQPENIEWLACKMREVSALPSSNLSLLGSNGRNYAMKHFSKAGGVSKLAAVIMGVAGRSNS